MTQIVPFYRPRPRVNRGGRCYEYAFEEISRYARAGSPAPEMFVVHGTSGITNDEIEQIEAKMGQDVIRHCLARRGHAWIERGAFAYDWQLIARNRSQLAIQLGPGGGNPLPIARFLTSRTARETVRYSIHEVCKHVGAHGHSGPWEQPR